MIISIFFVIGALLLLFVPVELVALMWGNPDFFHRLLTIVTHMFGHANWAHLLGNYIFVFPYALYVESKIGWRRFCSWWVVAGLAALALDAIVVLLGQPQAGVIGSSGAAFGVVAAALWLFNDNKWGKIACRCLLAWHIGNQATMAWDAFFLPYGIAFAAHLGGILAGVYLAQRELKRVSK